ncbi:MAG TPA: response regulator [Ktedonobacteraceae bacterium]|jgi:DNA-binding response OmpR family regulator|nr:response regulator [Ktedonobacteraceae bacterium]
MNSSSEVLIVDDDPAIVEALSLMLEDAGYAVRTLREGETFEALQENVPGVLLLDIWLSGRDGSAICSYLKSQPATRHLPIILISANNNIVRIAADVGADDYLAKPFSMKEVVAKVGKYLSR